MTKSRTHAELRDLCQRFIEVAEAAECEREHPTMGDSPDYYRGFASAMRTARWHIGRIYLGESDSLARSRAEGKANALFLAIDNTKK